MLDPGRHRLEAGRFGARHDLLRRRRGREIDIGDGAAEERVAHRPADDARLLAAAVEDLEEPPERRPAQELGERRLLVRGHRNCPGTTRPFSRCVGSNAPWYRSAVSPV